MVEVLIKQYGDDKYKVFLFHDKIEALVTLTNMERKQLEICNNGLQYIFAN